MNTETNNTQEAGFIYLPTIPEFTPEQEAFSDRMKQIRQAKQSVNSIRTNRDFEGYYLNEAEFEQLFAEALEEAKQKIEGWQKVANELSFLVETIGVANVKKQIDEISLIKGQRVSAYQIRQGLIEAKENPEFALVQLAKEIAYSNNPKAKRMFGGSIERLAEKVAYAFGVTTDEAQIMGRDYVLINGLKYNAKTREFTKTITDKI